MSFESLGLAEALLRAVRACGYDTPTPIQRQAIPVVLAGDDLLAAAQTGTGKTAGFTLPLLQLLSAEPRRREPRCLVLVPTRELAAQVAASVALYGTHLPLKAAVVFGGVNIKPQMSQLRTGVDILVATPGRLLDLHGQGAVNLSFVKILVLDEADRMLDMGFIHDLRRILALIPPKRQNLLFSATFTPEVRRLAGTFLENPVSVDVSPTTAAAETVEQKMIRVEKDHKAELLSYLIRHGDWQQVLIFTRTKHGANRLAKRLDKDGIHSLAIHGNKSQAARTKALAQFKDGELRALVATDLAARGLDIHQLPRVINYELPNVPEDYVHRIGRTGRAGLTGQALSLVSGDELKFLRDIESLVRQRLQPETVPGFIPGVPEEADDRPPLQPRGRSSRGESSAGRFDGTRAVRSSRPEAGGDSRPPRDIPRPESRPARDEAPRKPAPSRGTAADNRRSGENTAPPRRDSSAGGAAGGASGEKSRPPRPGRQAPGGPAWESGNVSLSWKDHTGRRKPQGEGTARPGGDTRSTGSSRPSGSGSGEGSGSRPARPAGSRPYGTPSSGGRSAGSGTPRREPGSTGPGRTGRDAGGRAGGGSSTGSRPSRGRAGGGNAPGPGGSEGAGRRRSRGRGGE